MRFTIEKCVNERFILEEVFWTKFFESLLSPSSHAYWCCLWIIYTLSHSHIIPNFPQGWKLSHRLSWSQIHGFTVIAVSINHGCLWVTNHGCSFVFLRLGGIIWKWLWNCLRIINSSSPLLSQGTTALWPGFETWPFPFSLRSVLVSKYSM